MTLSAETNSSFSSLMPHRRTTFLSAGAVITIFPSFTLRFCPLLPSAWHTLENGNVSPSCPQCFLVLRESPVSTCRPRLPDFPSFSCFRCLSVYVDRRTSVSKSVVTQHVKAVCVTISTITSEYFRFFHHASNQSHVRLGRDDRSSTRRCRQGEERVAGTREAPLDLAWT